MSNNDKSQSKKKRRTYQSPAIQEEEVFERRSLQACSLETVGCNKGPGPSS